VGDRAVVGAGSVATRDVGDGEVVAGIPARPLRQRSPAGA
jgi:acetyltransferase-like isoleucine patch superfamily enzyme